MNSSKNLKSAWELASERIISSRYARQIEKDEAKFKKEEKERIDSLPDFVLAWEMSQKEDGDKKTTMSVVEDILEHPTQLHSQKKNQKVELKGNENMTQVESAKPMTILEPETYYENENIPELYWYGHFTSYSGFSRMNRALVFGLCNRGAKVQVDIQGCAIDVNSATKNQLDILSSVEISPKAPKVFGATLPLKMMHAGKKILYTMMETSETLHKDYVERINLFDEVWIPTNHGANIFRKNGVKRPIYVMPLGVDIERYNENIEPYNFNGSLNKFVFISVFKWGFRKGYDVLLKAYMDEFSSQDDVSLLLVTRCETDPNKNKIRDDFTNIRNGIDKTDEELPHISFHTKNVPEKDLPRFYKAANAFVLISRGEGFGLPYYEAASCGIPVIGSNCSGQSDILTEDNSFLVDPDNYSKAKINGNMSNLAKHCHFYEDQMFPDFGQKAIKKTMENMRYVYENYQEALGKADKLKEIVRKNYSWDDAVDKILKRVNELQ